MNWNESLFELLTALGIGLLIGTVRERLHKPGAMKAGVRTHAIVALLGAITFSIGLPIFVMALLITGLMIAIGYYQSAQQDPGMTGEFALLLTLVLSGLSMQDPSLSAAIGVVVACLLFVKKPLRRFSQEVLTEQELEDALMLCASALVVLPLLPTTPIDPWNALNPYAMWKIVVLIMGIGIVAHICMRASGVRWGLPLAGFFTGFISSTLAVATYGQKVRENPHLESMASAAALLSTLSSLMLFTLVLAVSGHELMLSVKWPLLSAGAALLCFAAYVIRHTDIQDGYSLPATEHAFKASHALIIAITISTVTLCSAWLRHLMGDSGAFATSAIVGLVEIHAAAVSIAQLNQHDPVQSAYARWGVMAILASSASSKIVLSYVSGSRGYGHRISAGLGAMLLAAITSMLLLS
jgi:uncharacterized membrane protein (DUF4010 family)